MDSTIGQRELRNDSGAVMRRVEQGERFIVTRNGTPIADLVPHVRAHEGAPRTLGELQNIFGELPVVDAARWAAERRAIDELLGDDDPLSP